MIPQTLYCAGHINNLYNTCFWALVHDGVTNTEAVDLLRVYTHYVCVCGISLRTYIMCVYGRYVKTMMCQKKFALTMMCQKKLCMHLYTYIGTTTFANGLFTQAYVCKHDTL